MGLHHHVLANGIAVVVIDGKIVEVGVIALIPTSERIQEFGQVEETKSIDPSGKIEVDHSRRLPFAVGCDADTERLAGDISRVRLERDQVVVKVPRSVPVPVFSGFLLLARARVAISLPDILRFIGLRNVVHHESHRVVCEEEQSAADLDIIQL
jgi:hypothetical protein